MINSQGWKERILYVFIIGNKIGADGPVIEGREISRTIRRLFTNLRNEHGCITTMKSFKATGETSTWNREPTTIAFILSEVGDEVRVDSSISGQAMIVAETLVQDQVWITKQRLNLHIACRPN